MKLTVAFRRPQLIGEAFGGHGRVDESSMKGLGMIDVRAVLEFYRYNRWANARVFEAVSVLTQEQSSRI